MGIDPKTWWVPLGVAFLAGGGFKTITDIVRDWWTKASGKRRAEVDRMATLLTEEQAARKVAERRERIATEWGHANRVAAIKAGCEISNLPDLNFKDD